MDRLRDLAHIRSRDHSPRPRPHVRDLLRYLHRPCDHNRAFASASSAKEPRRTMSEPEIVAGILLLALTAYAVLAGAGLGGGGWGPLARGPPVPRPGRAAAP